MSSIPPTNPYTGRPLHRMPSGIDLRLTNEQLATKTPDGIRNFLHDANARHGFHEDALNRLEGPLSLVQKEQKGIHEVRRNAWLDTIHNTNFWARHHADMDLGDTFTPTRANVAPASYQPPQDAPPPQPMAVEAAATTPPQAVVEAPQPIAASGNEAPLQRLENSSTVSTPRLEIAAPQMQPMEAQLSAQPVLASPLTASEERHAPQDYFNCKPVAKQANNAVSTIAKAAELPPVSTQPVNHFGLPNFDFNQNSPMFPDLDLGNATGEVASQSALHTPKPNAATLSDEGFKAVLTKNTKPLIDEAGSIAKNVMPKHLPL